ncbi:helix-turn-helix domain-containing protein [Clostridium saccharoperbutylacetonicum]
MRVDLKDEFKDLPTNSIAENLIRFRKLNNLTQKELSLLTGINKSSISKYERGELFPSRKNSIILADFFRLDTKYFHDDYF